MPDINKLEETPRKELHVFYVLDTSGSMEGRPIAELNHAMEECTTALKELAKNNGDAKLKIAVMQFDTDYKWITENGPELLEDFEWEYLETGGAQHIGAALTELNNKLSEDEFVKSLKGAFMPAIIFMTNGHSTDDYIKPLEEIRKNQWFQHATKIGFAIGDGDVDADIKMIAEIIGNKESIIKTSDIDLFKKLMKFVSVRDSFFDDLHTPSKTSDDDWDDDDWDKENKKKQKETVKNTKAKITMEFTKSQQIKSIVESATKSVVNTMLNTILQNEEEKTLNLNIESKNINNKDLNKKVVIELHEIFDFWSNGDWDEDDW